MPNLFPLCSSCQHFPCLRGNVLCPRCSQRCYDVSENSQPCYLSIVDERSSKFTTVKQTFLSRWYGHGGCGARVEQVVALFNPVLFTKYIEFQKEWIASKATRGGQEPFLNERRLYVPYYPKYTCSQFLPTTSKNPSPAPHPPQGFGGQQPLSNAPVKPCCDPECELCSWILNGVPQIPEGRTGSSGAAYYLSYEPTVALRPEGNNVAKASEPVKYSLAEPQNTTERKQRICVLCRAVVGNTHWACAPCENIPTGIDSTLIERQGFSDVVIPGRDAVLPVFLIVCSSEY